MVTDIIATIRENEAANEQLMDALDYAVGIYQLDDSPESREFRFERLSYLEKQGISPKRDRYLMVYSYGLNEQPQEQEVFSLLESIYETFNCRRPKDFIGHSLSVSDVVAIKFGEAKKAYYCDSFGFKEIEGFYTLASDTASG